MLIGIIVTLIILLVAFTAFSCVAVIYALKKMWGRK